MPAYVGDCAGLADKRPDGRALLHPVEDVMVEQFDFLLNHTSECRAGATCTICARYERLYDLLVRSLLQ